MLSPLDACTSNNISHDAESSRERLEALSFCISLFSRKGQGTVDARKDGVRRRLTNIPCIFPAPMTSKQPLKALIVEDNAFMATVLHDLLKQHASAIVVLGIAHTGREALRLIDSEKPNVVFLDIELPDMTGFELLQQLDDIPFQTIFTTSHSHYAIKAFRFNALDYLIKPIKESELDEAIKRLLKSASNRNEVKNALSNLEAQSVENQKLVLPTQNGTLRLPLKQITHIEGERNYSYIHLTNGSRELSSKNLAYFDDILLDKSFFRSHRSYLVNRYHIEALKMDHFILKNGFEIPISRRKKTEANNWFFSTE